MKTRTPLINPSLVTGFTLVELMITLSIFATIMVFAAPSFHSFTANQHAKKTAQSLHSSMNYARSEAIRQNTTASVEPLNDDWETGWRLLVNGDEIQRVEKSDRSQFANTPTSTEMVNFSRDGRALSNMQFQVCDSDKSDAVSVRVVRVDLSGRPTISLGGSCGDI